MFIHSVVEDLGEGEYRTLFYTADAAMDFCRRRHLEVIQDTGNADDIEKAQEAYNSGDSDTLLNIFDRSLGQDGYTIDARSHTVLGMPDGDDFIQASDGLVHYVRHYPLGKTRGETRCYLDFAWSHARDPELMAGYVPPEPVPVTCLACLSGSNK